MRSAQKMKVFFRGSAGFSCGTMPLRRVVGQDGSVFWGRMKTELPELFRIFSVSASESPGGGGGLRCAKDGEVSVPRIPGSCSELRTALPGKGGEQDPQSAGILLPRCHCVRYGIFRGIGSLIAGEGGEERRFSYGLLLAKERSRTSTG